MDNKAQKHYESVLDYLQYLDYPYWIEQYNQDQIDNWIASECLKAFDAGINVRMTALYIIGLTFQQLKYDSKRAN